MAGVVITLDFIVLWDMDMDLIFGILIAIHGEMDIMAVTADLIIPDK